LVIGLVVAIVELWKSFCYYSGSQKHMPNI